MHRFEDDSDLRPAGSWPELIERSRCRGRTLRRRRRLLRAAAPSAAALVLVAAVVTSNIAGRDGGSSVRMTDRPSHGNNGRPWPDSRDGAGRSPAGSTTHTVVPRIPGQQPSNVGKQGSTKARSVGHIVFSSDRGGGTSHIYVMRADGSELRQLTTGPAWDSQPALSPDGRRVAFTRSTQDPRGDYQRAHDSVYLVDIDGSDLTAMVSSQDSSSDDPAWSPDGTELAYRMVGSSTSEIWVESIDHTALHEVSPNNMNALWPAWSPDGTKLVFHLVSPTMNDSSAPGLFVVNAADGSDLRQLTWGEDFSPAWSPDGRSIAFSSLRDGRSDLYVLDISHGALTRLTDATTFDDSPTWSPDGSVLLFDRDPDRTSMTGCTELPSPSPRSGPACVGQPSPVGPAPGALWSLDLRDRRQQQLTHSGSNDLQPDWGP